MSGSQFRLILFEEPHLLEVVQPLGEEVARVEVVVVDQEGRSKHDHQEEEADEKPKAAHRGRSRSGRGRFGALGG